MPLDINFFRADRGGDPEKIKESQRRRFKPVELVDEIIAKDNEWRQLTGSIDFLKKDRNAVQKQVAAKKKAKEECDDLVAQIKQFDIDILKAESDVEQLKQVVDSMVSKVGNIVDDSVPISQDEDAHNLVVKTWGTPRNPAGLLNHHDLLWRIGGYEPERGVAVAGHRGYFLKDAGVMLNQAFINYGISFLRQREYSILQPPYFMKKDVMSGVAQLEQFDEELYKVGSGDDEEKYLIATSEQPICGYHMGEWIPEKELPIRLGGVSTCFRKEAGAHGKDTWGIFRVHQFEKVEQFILCEGDLSVSQKMQEEMIQASEEFYQSLGFPYHVISIVSGALNNAAIKKLDLECWFPGYNAYRELVSCSNCTDYQSRAMEIRCGTKKLGEKDKKYVHMLNATLCATGRAICCLLETYQEADGVRIPEVLVPFMGGITFLPFVRDSRNAPSAGLKQAAPSAASAPKVSSDSPAASVSSGEKKTVADSPAVVVSAAPEVAFTPEGEALRSQIEAVGGDIRTKKAEKASKDEIKALVDKLVELKVTFTTVTGYNFGPPMVLASANSVSKEASSKEAKQATVSASPAAPPAHALPPAVPILPPASVQEATPRRTRISLPPTTSVFKQDIVDVPRLEAQLTTHSFVSGFQPSAEDLRVISVLSGGITDVAELSRWCASSPYPSHPQISRWLRVLAALSPDVLIALR